MAKNHNHSHGHKSPCNGDHDAAATAVVVKDNTSSGAVAVAMTHRGKEDQKRRKSRIIRLGTMLVAIVVFCVVELVIGHLAHSLALVADSFHMMSDALSLIIAAVAIRMGGKINKASCFL